MKEQLISVHDHQYGDANTITDTRFHLREKHGLDLKGSFVDVHDLHDFLHIWEDRAYRKELNEVRDILARLRERQ